MNKICKEICQKKVRESGITEADFFNGVFAVLTLNDYRNLIYGERLEEGLAKISREFERHIERRRVESFLPRQPRPFRGDSETIRNGVLNAIRRGIISLDSPRSKIIRIKLTKDMARLILDDPIKGKLFSELAPKIIDILSHQTSSN